MEKKLIALCAILFVSCQVFAGTCESTEGHNKSSVAIAKELLSKVDIIGVSKASIIAASVLSSKNQMQSDPVFLDVIKITLDAQIKKASDEYQVQLEKSVDLVARMPKKDLKELKAGVNTWQMAQYYLSLDHQKNEILGLWQLLKDGGNAFSIIKDLYRISVHMINFISLTDLSALNTLSAQDISQVKAFLGSALYKKFIKVSSSR